MTSTPIPIRAKPPAFSAAIFPPFWEAHVVHFWVHGWGDSGSQQHTAMLSPSLSLTAAAQKSEISLNQVQDGSVLRCWWVLHRYEVCCHLAGLLSLVFGVAGDRKREEPCFASHTYSQLLEFDFSGPQSISGIVSEENNFQFWFYLLTEINT